MAKVIITSSKLRTPTRSKNNILTLYSPRSCYIETANTVAIDTELILDLPKDSTANLVTKFEGQKIKTKRGDIIGYLVIELEDLKIQYEKKNPPDKTRRHPDNYLPKDWSKNWKKYWQKKKGVSASNRRVFKLL